MYLPWLQCQGELDPCIKGPVPLLTKALFWTFENKQTNAICIGGTDSTTHDAFFTHQETIEHLINIEFPGVSWQSTWLIVKKEI